MEYDEPETMKDYIKELSQSIAALYSWNDRECKCGGKGCTNRACPIFWEELLKEAKKLNTKRNHK